MLVLLYGRSKGWGGLLFDVHGGVTESYFAGRNGGNRGAEGVRSLGNLLWRYVPVDNGVSASEVERSVGAPG